VVQVDDRGGVDGSKDLAWMDPGRRQGLASSGRKGRNICDRIVGTELMKEKSDQRSLKVTEAPPSSAMPLGRRGDDHFRSDDLFPLWVRLNYDAAAYQLNIDNTGK
jgi:hypothetical protein